MTSVTRTRSRARNRAGAIITTVLLGASAAIIPATGAHAAPVTITVCALGCDFTTIQAGIDAAVSGDTVSVAAGTYAEELSIATSGISIVGAGQASTIVVPARDYANNNRGLSIRNAGDLVLEGFTIDGGGNAALAAGENFHDGIWWEGGGNNVTIRDVTVTNIDRRGISVFPETVTGTLITGVTVSDVTAVRTGNTNGYGLMFNGTGVVENSTFANVKAAIGGTSQAPVETSATFRGLTIRDLTGIDVGRFNIGINFWSRNNNPVIVTGNTIEASVERNSGIYVVDPGIGSTISGNTIKLGGAGGIGIETGWSDEGPEITGNTVLVSTGGLGILSTGQGSASDPTVISGNVLRNTSTAGAQTLTYLSAAGGREAGIIVSADKATSRTGDAGAASTATITGNDIAGFSTAIAYIEDAAAARTLSVTTTGNTIRATGHAVVHATETAALGVVLVAVDSTVYPAVDVSGNFWGVSAPDFSQLASGWVVSSSVVTEQPPLAEDSDALANLLEQLGIAPDAGNSLYTPPAGTTVDLSAFSADALFTGTIEWSSADTWVNLTGYSTPVFLGTFPVVSGKVVVEELDLGELLGEGAHTLVFQGAETGSILPLSIGIVPAGEEEPGEEEPGEEEEPPGGLPQKGDPRLAATGTDLSSGMLGIGVILLLGGALTVAMRIRRQHT